VFPDIQRSKLKIYCTSRGYRNPLKFYGLDVAGNRYEDLRMTILRDMRSQ